MRKCYFIRNIVIISLRGNIAYYAKKKVFYIVWMCGEEWIKWTYYICHIITVTSFVSFFPFTNSLLTKWDNKVFIRCTILLEVVGHPSIIFWLLLYEKYCEFWHTSIITNWFLPKLCNFRCRIKSIKVRCTRVPH